MNLIKIHRCMAVWKEGSREAGEEEEKRRKGRGEEGRDKPEAGKRRDRESNSFHVDRTGLRKKW